MHRSHHNARCAPVENPVPSARHQLAIAHRAPRHPEARPPIIRIAVDQVRADPRIGQRQRRIQHRRLRHALHVVAQPQRHRQVVQHTPFILRKAGIFSNIRKRPRPSRARSRKRLRKGRTRARRQPRQAPPKIIQAGKSVAPRKIAGEEVENVVAHEIESILHRVPSGDPRVGVRELPAVNRRLARAEEIPPHGEGRLRALPYQSLRQIRIRLSRLLVLLPAQPHHVDLRWIHRSGQREGQAIRIHQRRARMLLRHLIPAALAVPAGKAPAIPARVQRIRGINHPVAFQQNHIVIRGPQVVRLPRLQIGQCLRFKRRRGHKSRRQLDKRCLRELIALPIVIEEEEQLVLHYRPAYVPAKLVEVIRRLRPVRIRGNQIARIERAIAVEPERRAMKIIRPRLVDHIDHRAARAPKFRRVGIRVHLKFLYRILAELVGIAHARASQALSKKRIVIV